MKVVGLVESSSTVGQRDTFNFVPIRSVKSWLSREISLPLTTAEGHKSGVKEKLNDPKVPAVLLLAFLAAPFFLRHRLTEKQQHILRFICALCAGFCGGAITRDALFRLDTEISDNSNLLISGSAGFALFLAVLVSRSKPLSGHRLFHFILASQAAGASRMRLLKSRTKIKCRLSLSTSRPLNGELLLKPKRSGRKTYATRLSVSTCWRTGQAPGIRSRKRAATVPPQGSDLAVLESED